MGSYELSPRFVITVSKDGKQLKAKATDREENDFDPKSENAFYAKEVEIKITFNANKDRQLVSLTLLTGGQESIGLKLKK